MKLTSTQKAWLASVRERACLKSKVLWLQYQFVKHLHDSGLKQRQIKEKLPFLSLGYISSIVRDTGWWQHNINGMMSKKKLTNSDSVNELVLTVRAANVLNNAGIDTIGKLLNCTDKFFSKCRNCGLTTVALIDQELERHGLKRNTDSSTD